MIDVKVAQSVQAKLTLYIQEQYPEIYGDRKRPMVLICPGGGYGHVSPREGEPIALQFMAAGCNAAVLKYDVTEGENSVIFPQHLLELAASVSYIREHADELAVKKDQILVGGCSAGGHLVESVGCYWHEE